MSRRTALIAAIVSVAFAGRAASARVQILVANNGAPISADQCGQYLAQEVLGPMLRSSLSGANWERVVTETREAILAEYERLEVVPKDEMVSLREEEKHFPAGAVAYFRVINDYTGDVEEMGRLVAAETGVDQYFHTDLATKRFPTDVPRLPMAVKYPQEEFQRFLRQNFHRAHEIGRVRFARGMSEEQKVRAHLEATVAIASFLHLRRARGYQSSGHYLLAESVTKGIKFWGEFGMALVPFEPIQFADGRKMLAMPVQALFDRYFGDVRLAHVAMMRTKPTPEAILATVPLFQRAIDNVSRRESLRTLFGYGQYHLAQTLYAGDDIEGFSKLVLGIAGRHRSSREFRLFELYARVATFYNWETHAGNVDAAIAYLDSAEADALFRDELLQDDLYPGALSFVKGFLWLKAGRPEMARRELVAIDESIIAGAESAIAKQQVKLQALSFQAANNAVLTLQRQKFDPATGEGDPIEALAAAEACEHESPLGLSSAVWAYKADILDSLKRHEEAAMARHNAAVLAYTPAELGHAKLRMGAVLDEWHRLREDSHRAWMQMQHEQQQ